MVEDRLAFAHERDPVEPVDHAPKRLFEPVVELSLRDPAARGLRVTRFGVLGAPVGFVAASVGDLFNVGALTRELRFELLGFDAHLKRRFESAAQLGYDQSVMRLLAKTCAMALFPHSALEFPSLLVVAAEISHCVLELRKNLVVTLRRKRIAVNREKTKVG
ncbi:MAG: hypothetical protein ACLFVJ_23055 [Persicimonas sp.]